MIYYLKASGRINLQLSMMQKSRSHGKMLQCSRSISIYKIMVVCSHLPISQIPGHMVFLPPLCWHWCLSDSTVSQLTGRKFTSKRKVNTFPYLFLLWRFFVFGFWVFPPLDFFRVQSLPQDFIKLSGTPVPARQWTAHRWSWWVCYPWNLALRGTPLGVKLLLQPKNFNLLVRWAVSPWTLYTASCRVDLCWTSSHFRPSSGNLIVSLRIYGHVCHWKLWLFHLKSKHLPWVIT